MKCFCFFLILVLVNVSAVDDDKTRLTKEIFLTNKAIEMAFLKNESGINGLEYVIEKMVNDGPSSVKDIKNYYGCFELGWNCPPMIKGMHYQYIMRQEIRKTLGINVPEADHIQDWGSILLNTSYEDLVEHRLRHVKPALDNIITRKYYIYVPEVVLEQNGIVRDAALYRLCRLKGIYTSITFPTYIREVAVYSINGTCIMNDGITKQLYQKINNTWSIINPGNSSVQQIEDQLALSLGSLRIG